ncbi:hypothetical protein MAPG_09916 [Magnaporthiopsis poae ATCC 64411]|uniref:Uncharacterized protein n=1 Tax=Magnaporthiopsis poae (strain ATCC 64411 / 73-15) TaxID=644358 RepID=A0A0C4EB70_MAGP6|nr:hypothetical protein MAPG_09916 [Magnaporthiopsis poae ATCC 64411]
MKFSAVLLFALGASAAVIREVARDEAHDDVLDVLAGRDAEAEAACRFTSCPSPVRIKSATCRCDQHGPCALYACKAGKRAYCGKDVSRCVPA